MPIEFQCPQCQQLLRVPDDSAGKPARCPNCQTVTQTPSVPLENMAAGPAPAANPFESPKTTAYEPHPGFGPGSGRVTPTAIDAGATISEAFEVAWANYGLLLGVSAVMFLVNGAASGVNYALQQSGEDILVLMSFGVNLIANLISLFLGIGQTRICLKLGRRQPSEFAELFSGGRLFLPVLGASILAAIAMWVGFMLCIIPGLVLAVLFWPFYFLVIDEKTGVFDSFSTAYELGSRNVGPTLLLWITCFGIGILGLLACLVGIIFVQPFLGMMLTIAYLRMSSQLK